MVPLAENYGAGLAAKGGDGSDGRRGGGEVPMVLGTGTRYRHWRELRCDDSSHMNTNLPRDQMGK